MTTWIALLRGINVGGNNPLPMTGLRALLSELGCTRVRTYIQSGNAVFEHGDGAEALARNIRAGIARRFGYDLPVMVMSVEELRGALARNPFADVSDPSTVHLYFLAKVPEAPDLAALSAVATGSEHITLDGRVFYLHAPDGIGRSKLATRVERHLGAPATARNLRSALKIAALAD